MQARDYRDIWGGGFLVLVGAGAALDVTAKLQLGSIARMGPGMFPTALAVLLIVIGLAILVPALFRQGEPVSLDWRSLGAILLSVLAFGLMIRTFGMVPAIIVQTLIATLADGKLGLVRSVTLSVCVALLAYLIFKAGLGLPVAAVNWPW